MYVIIYGAIFLIIIACVIPMSSGVLAALGMIFAVIAVIAIAKRNFDLKKSTLKRYGEDMLIIQNVKEGGVIKLANVDGYNEDLELKVVGRNLYMEGDYSWYELECVRGDGEKVWVDVEDDDDLLVSVVLKKLNKVDVMESMPLSTIWEEESGNVLYKQIKYYYKDCGDAVFYKHCDDKHKEKLRYFDFKNGNYLVSIEEWKNDDGKQDTLYYYSQIIRPSSITVYSTGREGNK